MKRMWNECETKWNEMKRNETNVKQNESKWNEMKWNKTKWNEMKRMWNKMKQNETKWNKMKQMGNEYETKWNKMKQNETNVKRNEKKWNECERKWNKMKRNKTNVKQIETKWNECKHPSPKFFFIFGKTRPSFLHPPFDWGSNNQNIKRAIYSVGGVLRNVPNFKLLYLDIKQDYWRVTQSRFLLFSSPKPLKFRFSA